ncbi:MAG: LLM class flavin-dependent oxidoreductase, partial [Actinobacteria bacterium]|nr:LLM class flavin-dependent oxidoreductase [Actinomycetota bacterium]
WMREEFDAVGVSYSKRGERLEEYARALRTIWSGDPSSFDGEFYSWTEAGFLPAPTKPIPLIFGGHGDRALERAARVGDGWAVVTAPGQGAGLVGHRRASSSDGGRGARNRTGSRARPAVARPTSIGSAPCARRCP